MEFFNSAVDTLQTIVVGLGGALCVWGGVNLLEGYDNYMNCLCTRTLYDEDGYPHLCVDEYMKRCLEIRLIQAIVKV